MTKYLGSYLDRINRNVGRAVYDEGLPFLPCWGGGLESRRGHECLSLVRVVSCQLEVSATRPLLDQRSPTDCDVSLSVIRDLKNNAALACVGLLGQRKI